MAVDPITEWQTRDPRTDLPDDRAAWEQLLRAAWVRGGGVPSDLHAALHLMRCLGATIRAGSVVRPAAADLGDVQADYDQMRGHLVPHAPWLRAELARTVDGPEAAPAARVVAYADGRIVPGEAAIALGWVLCGEDGNAVLARGGRVIARAGSQLEAEYQAVIAALDAAASRGVDRVELRMDSKAAISGLQGRTGGPEVPAFAAARAAAEQIGHVEYRLVSAARNAVADGETRKALRQWTARRAGPDAYGESIIEDGADA